MSVFDLLAECRLKVEEAPFLYQNVKTKQEYLFRQGIIYKIHSTEIIDSEKQILSTDTGKFIVPLSIRTVFLTGK